MICLNNSHHNRLNITTSECLEGVYFNGKYRGDDEIGKLMHDFSCINPDDMNCETLAKKARYFKQGEKGVAAITQAFEIRQDKN